VLDLWGVLGHDRVASRVAEAMRSGTHLCLLEGPPGVGKSWLARDIGALWDSGGGSTVLIEGDQLRADASLYPFAFAMAGLPSAWAAVGPLVAGIARASESLVGTFGLLTSTVQAVGKASGSRRQERTKLLGDAEQIILSDLERLAKNRPLLLIADNLHWWDTSSLAFLGRLRDERMWEAFPFLSDLRILGVETIEPYQVVSNRTAHEALLAPSITSRFPLPRVPRDGFENVLAALGAVPPPDPDVTSAVYGLTGGHLALASRCAARIAEGDAETFLAASDTESFLHALLAERIASLGEQGQQAIAILQVAALLGATFRRDEVCCAADTEEPETLRLMRYCRGEGVLEVADGLERFVHDVYRQYFLD
jgi:hypothetical protein